MSALAFLPHYGIALLTFCSVILRRKKYFYFLNGRRLRFEKFFRADGCFL
jgi:hypothetical protein